MSEDLQKGITVRNPQEFEKLSDKTIAICGCGGLGSQVANHLARSNIKKLILIDFDKVEPSNLNRQQFFINQIGQEKARTLAENLTKINPFIELETHNCRINAENTIKLIKNADIIAECFDNAEAKATLVNTVLANTKIPIVAVSGIAGFRNCEKIVSKKINSKFYLIGDYLQTETIEKNGVSSAKVGVAAAIQAAKILEILID